MTEPWEKEIQDYIKKRKKVLQKCMNHPGYCEKLSLHQAAQAIVINASNNYHCIKSDLSGMNVPFDELDLEITAVAYSILFGEIFLTARTDEKIEEELRGLYEAELYIRAYPRLDISAAFMNLKKTSFYSDLLTATGEYSEALQNSLAEKFVSDIGLADREEIFTYAREKMTDMLAGGYLPQKFLIKRDKPQNAFIKYIYQ